MDKPTEEMVRHSEARTNKHINLVRKYCKKLEHLFPELAERAKVHDQSKFEDPEKTIYAYINWMYKKKDDGEEFDMTEELQDAMNIATIHHICSNSHHPEFYDDREDKTSLLNPVNRDQPPEEIVDGSGMSDVDIAEMVADWSAVAEERGNTPKSWADKNIGIRWEFTEDQTELIYDLIAEAWDD